MKIVWDEPKRADNIKIHHIDFEDISESFEFSSALIESTYPSSGGQPRFKAIGPLGDDLVAVVYSLLGTEAISIISARPASRKERRRYVGT